MAIKISDSPIEQPQTNLKYNKNSFEIVEPNRRIQFIKSEYDKAYSFDQDNRDRCENNWKMYSGFEHGQWPTQSINDLKSQNRHIAQYNFIRGKVDGLAGSIVKNWFDIDFVPVDGEYSNLTQALKELFYSDKEMMDWNDEYMLAVIDGLVYGCVEQMVINTRYNDLGNIGFERILPGHIILDPHWKTNSGWDLKKAWKIAYLNPKEIMEIYDHKSERIKERVDLMVLHGQSYQRDETSGTVPHFNLDNIYGTQYRVIEFHHIEKEKKEFEYVVGIDDKPDVKIPEGTKPFKQEWIMNNRIDTSNGIIKKKATVDTYYVSTICPDLDNEQMLEDRKSEIQIGRLPFFIWSAARINGINSGIVELLEDAQLSLNKRESLLEHMIATSSMGGLMIDPAIVGNDSRKQQYLLDNANKPNFKMLTESGALASGREFFKRLPEVTYQSEIHEQLERMSEYMDRLSKQTATLEGRNESSHDTGILFARRQIQSEIAQTVLVKGLERYWNEKGEAYLLFAPQLYGGTYREFTTSSYNGKENRNTVAINDTVDTPVGKITYNDITTLPRHKVIVTQSPQGITVRATERAISAELLRSIPENNIVSKAQLTKNIMETLDNKDDDREKLKAAAELEYQLAVETIKTQIVSMKSQQAQLAQQMQMGQMGMQPGQEQGQQPAPQEQGAQPGQEIPLR